MKICIVSPCYNEEEVVDLFYAELKKVLRESCAEYDHEIILVDDGSRDHTLKRLNALAAADSAVRVYSFSRNFGHQAALSAGLAAARGDAVIVMDADLQHPPSLLPRMLALWREGHDVVTAVRQRTTGAGIFKSLTSDGFYDIFNLLSDTQLVRGAADFCLLSRQARKALLKMPERHRFLRGMIAWMGFPRAELPYEAPRRGAGSSKYTTAKMLRMAFDAIYSFTGKPLRMAARLGLLITCCGFLYLAYILFRYFGLGDMVQGWPSVISATLILGGAQLFSIGLLGEYLVRVYEETKGRPLYLFKQRPPSRPRRTPEQEKSCHRLAEAATKQPAIPGPSRPEETQRNG